MPKVTLNVLKHQEITWSKSFTSFILLIGQLIPWSSDDSFRYSIVHPVKNSAIHHTKSSVSILLPCLIAKSKLEGVKLVLLNRSKTISRHVPMLSPGSTTPTPLLTCQILQKLYRQRPSHPHQLYLSNCQMSWRHHRCRVSIKTASGQKLQGQKKCSYEPLHGTNPDYQGNFA